MRQNFIPPTINFNPNLRPNAWDLAALPLVLGILWLLAFGGMQMSTPYNIGDALTVSSDPLDLPYYLLRSFLRMAAGLAAAPVLDCAIC